MRSIVYFLFFVFIFASCKKENNRDQGVRLALCMDITILKTNISETLLSVFFLNAKNGFVSGFKGGIYRTTDSARHWTRLNSTVDLPIRSLFFTDSLKGFAVGGQNSCGGTGCISPGGFILKTIDGGQTWIRNYTPTQTGVVSSIYFVNELVGFCVGGNVILKTLDAGQTWSEYKVAGFKGEMMQVKFVNNQKGYVVCLFDNILRTEDGGLTWQLTNPGGGDVGYYAVTEANGTTYVSGQGKIIKSVNGGSSWVELPNAPRDIFAIHFNTDKKGYAFGRGNYSGGDFGYSYGSIYCTNDGGETWNGNANVEVFGLFTSVSFPAGNVGYAVSSNSVVRFLVK